MASAEATSAPRSSMMIARRGPRTGGVTVGGVSGGAAGSTFAGRRDLKMELAADLILSQPARERQSARQESAKAADDGRANRAVGDFTSCRALLSGLLCRSGSLQKLESAAENRVVARERTRTGGRFLLRARARRGYVFAVFAVVSR